MKLYDILTKDNVVKSIDNNLIDLLEQIPEIVDMIGFDHKHPHHDKDVWHHTLYALNLSENDFEIRLTLLLHDIGKPHSYQDDGEIRHFENHPAKSEEISRKILTRLGYDDEFINRICYLILNHDLPITTKQIIDDYELTNKLYKVQYCDALAHHPEKLEKRKEYLEKTKQKILQNKKD